MRTLSFAKRNMKEIMRDPVSLIFSLFLPAFLLFIFQQFDIPSEVYNINNFAPSIVIFSYGFVSLFAGQLISKDRYSSFLSRLFISPLKSFDFILGYTLSMLPMVIIQSVLFFGIGVAFGLTFSINLLYTILILIPVSLVFIGLGLLIGCFVSDKSAPGVCSIVIQLVAFTSGMWFDTSMVGKTFGMICDILPFKYLVNISKAFSSGNFNGITNSLLVMVVSIVVVYTLTIIMFKTKMNGEKI